MSVSERAIHLGIVVCSALACAWVFGLHSDAPRAVDSVGRPQEAAIPKRTALALVPSGPAFVLTAEVRKLQHTPLGELLSQRLGRADGAGEFVKLCGIDPLARLDQLAVAVPSAGSDAQEHPEDFGIVAEGRFNAAEIVRCARSVIVQRGGEAIETRLGKFRSVRDRKQSGEIAATDGTLIVSGGSYFRRFLDAAEGNAGSMRDPNDERHAELRRRLGPGSVVATWILGDRWFDRIAGDERGARLSPLHSLSAIGVWLDVSDAVHVRATLDCANPEDAGRVAGLLAELRASLRALPLDPTLSALAARVSVSQAGARLELGVEPTQAELDALLGLLLGP